MLSLKNNISRKHNAYKHNASTYGNDAYGNDVIHNRARRMACLLCSFIFSFLYLSTYFIGSATATPDGFGDLVKDSTPAVVNISTVTAGKGVGLVSPFSGSGSSDSAIIEEFRKYFERHLEAYQKNKKLRSTSLGSGFIIDKKGIVITNNHVIANADEIKITLQDDREFNAKIIGRDTKVDIAVLKIDSDEDLPYVEFGDSEDVSVGDWIIAVGNPFGLGGTVTAGIISARGREINGRFVDYLQTDASINRGNSGGPMFNIDGEVVGVNTAIFSPSGGNIGIGFATPSSAIELVVKQILKFGEVRRGWLGVLIQPVTENIAESIGLKHPHGALIIEVAKAGPAAKAGLKAGDVIIEFDGHYIKKMSELPRVVAATKVNKKVELLIFRGDERMKKRVTTGRLNDPDDKLVDKSVSHTKERKRKHQSQGISGISLANVTKELAENFGLDAENGVLVLESPYEYSKSGIRRGDLIISVNNKHIENITQIRRRVIQAEKMGRKYVLVGVVRGGDTLFVALPTAHRKKGRK